MSKLIFFGVYSVNCPLTFVMVSYSYLFREQGFIWCSALLYLIHMDLHHTLCCFLDRIRTLYLQPHQVKSPITQKYNVSKVKSHFGAAF